MRCFRGCCSTIKASSMPRMRACGLTSLSDEAEKSSRAMYVYRTELALPKMLLNRNNVDFLQHS